MKLIVRDKPLWLPNPANFVRMNFDDPKSVWEHAYLSDTEMRSSGWVLLGKADLHMTIDVSPDSLANDAAEAITIKMAELREAHERQMQALEEGLKKLQALTYTPKGE